MQIYVQHPFQGLKQKNVIYQANDGLQFGTCQLLWLTSCLYIYSGEGWSPASGFPASPSVSSSICLYLLLKNPTWEFKGKISNKHEGESK